jgi:hypothetical protein
MRQRRLLMASNLDEIVQQVQDDFQNLLAYVTGPDARLRIAYAVELALFRRLLALGVALLRLFFVTRVPCGRRSQSSPPTERV